MSESPLSVREEAWSGGDTRLARAIARPMVRFLAQETASGVLLLVATAAALLWANFGGDTYHHFWETQVDFAVGTWEPFVHNGHGLSLEAWVNDALMVLFFFVIGLEIKSELVVGDLRDPRVAALPAVAALGGMIVPAGLYMAFNAGGDGFGGWGIPMATDIAFAVGVLALMGPRVPQRLKLFLLTLAIVDDIGAIAVIAIFYSTGFSLTWLILAIGGLILTYALRRYRVWYVPIYILIGVFVWYATFRSGVHATIAGVALGLLAPARPLLGERSFENIEDIFSGQSTVGGVRNANWKARESVPITGRFIGLLSPWTSFLVIPTFALANAGVVFTSDAVSDAVSSPVTWGVIAGLVIGKPVGITLFAWIALRLKIADLPDGVSIGSVLAAGAVAGIGFTVALFIGGLAFEDEALGDQATIGILAASLVATVVGWILLRMMSPVESKPSRSSPKEALDA
jgi:NhaA family Na+:H+ antiporter